LQYCVKATCKLIPSVTLIRFLLNVICMCFFPSSLNTGRISRHSGETASVGPIKLEIQFEQAQSSTRKRKVISDENGPDEDNPTGQAASSTTSATRASSTNIHKGEVH